MLEQCAPTGRAGVRGPAATSGWWAAALAVFACGWGGNQFTPLLVLYRELGLSVAVVDALLGAYVVGLVPGLLLAGRLSERYGRKPLMVGGAVLSLCASALLAVPGVGWIAAGRFLTGLAVATAMSVGSTWVVELSVQGGAQRAAGTRRAALWLTLGFGSGAGFAGVLAQWAPFPTVLPYMVHAVLAALSLTLLIRVPETRGTPTAPRERGDHFARVRHPRFVKVILPMAPWIFGSAGVAYAIMPQLVGDELGTWGVAYSTLLTVCTLGAGALIQPLAKRLDRTTSARAVLLGMVVMSAGLAMSAGAAVVRSPGVALVAAVVLGLAYGIAVVSGLLEVQRLARAHELAALTGAYYALAYAGFLLPSILAVLSGVASYPVLLSALVLIALGGTLVIARNSRRHLPEQV